MSIPSRLQLPTPSATPIAPHSASLTNRASSPPLPAASCSHSQLWVPVTSLSYLPLTASAAGRLCCNLLYCQFNFYKPDPTPQRGGMPQAEIGSLAKAYLCRRWDAGASSHQSQLARHLWHRLLAAAHMPLGLRLCLHQSRGSFHYSLHCCWSVLRQPLPPQGCRQERRAA